MEWNSFGDLFLEQGIHDAAAEGRAQVAAELLAEVAGDGLADRLADLAADGGTAGLRDVLDALLTGFLFLFLLSLRFFFRLFKLFEAGFFRVGGRFLGSLLRGGSFTFRRLDGVGLGLLAGAFSASF